MKQLARLRLAKEGTTTLGGTRRGSAPTVVHQDKRPASHSRKCLSAEAKNWIRRDPAKPGSLSSQPHLSSRAWAGTAQAFDTTGARLFPNFTVKTRAAATPSAGGCKPAAAHPPHLGAVISHSCDDPGRQICGSRQRTNSSLPSPRPPPHPQPDLDEQEKPLEAAFFRDAAVMVERACVAVTRGDNGVAEGGKKAQPLWHKWTSHVTVQTKLTMTRTQAEQFFNTRNASAPQLQLQLRRLRDRTKPSKLQRALEARGEQT